MPAVRRPFVFLNVAMTADGKIAPSNRQFQPFGSPRDIAHLYELRATADAVMSGARTLDTMPVLLGSGGPKYRRMRLRRGLAEYSLRVIVTGGGTIDPRAEIFRHRFSPILVLTTARAGRRRLAQLRQLADEVKICGRREIDFTEALAWLREKWKVKRLLCEGGGEVNGALYRAGLVDELHLTLCPFLLGGRSAPTLADGDGVDALADATKLELKSIRAVGDERFLVFRTARRR
jgi:riboflavin-specific deaminase-like protein